MLLPRPVAITVGLPPTATAHALALALALAKTSGAVTFELWESGR